VPEEVFGCSCWSRTSGTGADTGDNEDVSQVTPIVSMVVSKG
jgi:hypothetical protein